MTVRDKKGAGDGQYNKENERDQDSCPKHEPIEPAEQFTGRHSRSTT